MDTKEYIEQLESLVCFLADCYGACKKTYKDKHLEQFSIGNKNRKKLTKQQYSEIERFPLIQGMTNNFALERLSKLERGKFSITEIEKMIIDGKNKDK